MAEIFTKRIRKKIKENQNITHSDIYLMLNRYCETYYHGDTKPYPEELTYVLSCGLEKIKSIQSCTHIHAMHMPLIIDTMDYAIDDLRILMRKDYLVSEIEEHRNYYLGGSVYVLISIFKSIGLEHLVIQATDCINEKTGYDCSWDDNEEWFPLTKKEKIEFKKCIVGPQPNRSYIDNIPYEFVKIIHNALAEDEISRQVLSNYDDYISFKEIIKRLGPTYINDITAIKNFLSDVADKAKFDNAIRENLKTLLRETTANIIQKALDKGLVHNTTNNYNGPIGQVVQEQYVDHLTTK